jgi:tetratricopeptide (TPR) repeat protein
VVALAAVAAFALAAVAAIVFRGGDDASPAAERPAPAPSVEQQSRVTAATALAEARSQLAQGNLDGALQAVARAELAEPQSVETAALREEIAARQQEIAEGEKHARTEQALRAARYAFAERRYSEAISSAKGALAITSDSDEAKRILAESEQALRRMRERQEAIDEAQRQAALAAAAPPAPVVEVQATVAPAKDAQLRIDFASDRSEGVLTIYAADRQILREAFRFVRRTGFLARQKVSGTIEANRRLAPGPTTLRVYVALQGEATRAILLESDLEVGSSSVLEIRVDTDGNATAVVR